MLAPWVVNELKSVNLKDERLNDRLREVLAQLAAHPTASIPAACGGRAEMEAAYRLFDNDKVTFDNILQPHQEATRGRIADLPVVVLAQDTTEADFTRPEVQVRGAGPLADGDRRGAFLHLLHAFTPDGTPLGTVAATAWVREEGPSLRQSLTPAERRTRPLEEKESHRWIVALRRAQQVAREHPQTSVICVADSEADIYELLMEGTSEAGSAEWIVRACQDRNLEVDKDREEAARGHLREELLAQAVLFTQSITVRGRKAKLSCDDHGRRQPRESRKTDVEVRAARVTLRPPWRAGQKLPPVSVNVILVRETNPPEGDVRVEWLLLTSLSIDDGEAVRQAIEYYCVRWMIEIFFRTLKSGCRAEERRFETIDRQLRCLAVYLIVAWRTLYVCRLGQACPDVSCDAIFEPAEWKAVYRVVQKKPPPHQPPPLGEIIRLVAQLGGYVNRPRRDPPGPQTVWLGLQRMHDFALCWEMFGPETRSGP